jgi:hypothetical protein
MRDVLGHLTLPGTAILLTVLSQSCFFEHLGVCKPLNFCYSIFLDFGHSGINPLQTRQEQVGAVWKLGEVWWEGRHHKITQPPMPLP